MITIGLTGGIASGKSTVSRRLRQLGLPVFDADARSRAAVCKGSQGLALVIALFGEAYLTASGDLDRAKVAELVFHDRKALAKLEGVIHKVVLQEAGDFISAAKAGGAPLAVLDVPLLIECGWQKYVDQVWLVALSPEKQIERAMARSGMTEAEVKARIEAQMPLEEKKKYAQFVIDNNGPLEAALAQVDRQVEAILSGRVKEEN